MATNLQTVNGRHFRPGRADPNRLRNVVRHHFMAFHKNTFFAGRRRNLHCHSTHVTVRFRIRNEPTITDANHSPTYDNPWLAHWTTDGNPLQFNPWRLQD